MSALDAMIEKVNESDLGGAIFENGRPHMDLRNPNPKMPWFSVLRSDRGHNARVKT
jgi:hypothetical protein